LLILTKVCYMIRKFCHHRGDNDSPLLLQVICLLLISIY